LIYQKYESEVELIMRDDNFNIKCTVRKRNGTQDSFDINKILTGIDKSAQRSEPNFSKLTDAEREKFLSALEQLFFTYNIKNGDTVETSFIEKIVGTALGKTFPTIQKTYQDYNSWKSKYADAFCKVKSEVEEVYLRGDRSNANTNSAYVSTKRCLGYNIFNKEMYQMNFLTPQELKVCRDGYIYIHDMVARNDTFNCFRRSTKFMTEDGLKSFNDFEDGDHVKVFTHTGNIKDAVVHSYGKQKLVEVTFMRGDEVKVVHVTPSHRWILRDGTQTISLSVGDLIMKSPFEKDKDYWKVASISYPYELGEGLEVWCLEVEDDHSFILEGNIVTGNCMLFRMEDVMTDGFEMGDMWYTEPKTLDVAFDVMLAITKTAAAQQYGGFTIPRVDTLLAKYAEKSYNNYLKEYVTFAPPETDMKTITVLADRYAMYKVERDLEQGFQAVEYDLNTIGSSRGDYPFVAMTFGLDTSTFGKMVSKAMCKVRANGEGKPGNKKIVAFPKLVLLYDENLHGEGKPCEDVYNAVVECQSKAMYPDMISLTGEGYVADVYKKYGVPISEMGCNIGTTIINYKFNNEFYTETFTEFWDKISKIVEPYVQAGLDDRYLWIDSSNIDLQIYDTKVGYVKVNKLIRNYSYDWRKVTLTDDKFVICTNDHPFETENRGQVYAEDLHINDDIAVSDNGTSKSWHVEKVANIEVLTMEDYSYDVETWSGHFEMNGMYSHNCRAFLSPWFERGGMHPADDDDVPVFEGRANIGAISLNLPMIYQQSVEEHKDFYENLDMYLEMIRNLHQRTYEFLGKLKAGCNPMVFCQGGAYGGHLQPNDVIAPIIKSWTASFGITALNELQVLYNGKTIVEDGQFALEVLQHINDKVNKFKELDGHLYAIYSTPAEALCGTQVKQFRKKYGIIKGVSDKEYFTNSTHCPVYANITPFEKQDLEKRFWDLSNGGHIQYVRHTNDQNLDAFDAINKRAMKMGFYFGHNMDKCYCEDCGHEELDMQICPKCGSKNITEINRVCGYLGYSKIKGDSRMNDAKLAEIADRVSM
jgi:anaerobic ribonucleoside-triphosphate reductase